MKFKFSLQALLKKNEYSKIEAQKAFGEAQRALRECGIEIELMRKEISISHASIAEHSIAGGVLAKHKMQVLDEYIDRTKIKISRKENEFRRLAEVVEQRRHKMVDAVKEFRKIEILRDKRLIEWKNQQKKKSEKALDDIMIMRNHHLNRDDF